MSTTEKRFVQSGDHVFRIDSDGKKITGTINSLNPSTGTVTVRLDEPDVLIHSDHSSWTHIDDAPPAEKSDEPVDSGAVAIGTPPVGPGVTDQAELPKDPYPADTAAQQVA